MEPAYRYRATLHRVIDADTYELDVDCGFTVTVRVAVRLRGFNAPERLTRNASAATFAATTLLSGVPLIVETRRLRGPDAQSFAQYAADIYVADVHVGHMLESLGHGAMV
jgi:hypothetical protein